MNRDEVQAFPGFYGDHMEPHGGMTLRDWFAGQALAAVRVRDGITLPEDADSAMRIAECAYAVADAMLAARQREVPK